MITSITTQTVLLSDEGTHTQPGQVRIQSWDQKQRMIRALKWWGACCGAALFSILLPLLHFFLVPGFFLAGPIGAWLIYRRESVVLGGEGTCPHCRETMRIERGAPVFPMSDVCDHCKKNVKILDPQTHS